VYPLPLVCNVWWGGEDRIPLPFTKAESPKPGVPFLTRPGGGRLADARLEKAGVTPARRKIILGNSRASPLIESASQNVSHRGLYRQPMHSPRLSNPDVQRTSG